MDRTDQSLIALRRILRSTELYTRDLASAAGLTPAQLRVLQIVSGKGGTATPKELSKQMGVSQATVTALVDKLVARGHVARERSDVDRRQTNVNITARGRAAAALCQSLRGAGGLGADDAGRRSGACGGDA